MSPVASQEPLSMLPPTAPARGCDDQERCRPAATNRWGSGSGRLSLRQQKEEMAPNRLPALPFSSSSASTEEEHLVDLQSITTVQLVRCHNGLGSSSICLAQEPQLPLLSSC
ncbi:unnamed protein product [Urochloa humidicola]